MPPRKTNPFLLMPDLSDVGSMRAVEQQGQDCLDTLDQLDQRDDDGQSRDYDEIVHILHGDRED